MKKLSFILLSLVFFACSTEPQITTITGSVKNLGNRELQLTRLDGTDLVFVSNEEGELTVSESIETGYYNLKLGRSTQAVYLEPGANLSFSMDADDMIKSLVFEQDLAPENNYLLARTDQRMEFNKARVDLYKSSEADFLKRMNKGTEQDITVLGKTINISTSFMKKETENLMFDKLYRMKQYRPYHNYYAPEDKIETTSETFNEALPVVDMNNYQNYLNSSSYRGLLQDSMYEEADKIVKEDESLDYYYAYLLAIKKAELNPKIKSLMAYSNAQNAITYTEDLENYYATYKDLELNKEHLVEIDKVYEDLLTIAQGQTSPVFNDYENFKGGTNSLSDYTGKYVYLDIWAQWCGPCKREIPYLQKVEAQYHGKNIEFISISIDKKEDYDKWRAMVEDKNLGGVQLLADDAWSSEFIKNYLIRGIPRFILVDPEGKIVTSNAPRPSDEKLVKLFEDLKI
ncbi:TlpA family protein disulfide reductase [Flavobacteriaceae bacterium]|nr:TlpA family protein disulfide reductase [Flavobacteriaceae bacterium]